MKVALLFPIVFLASCVRYPISTSIEVETKAIRVNEPIVISINAKNTSNREIQIPKYSKMVNHSRAQPKTQYSSFMQQTAFVLTDTKGVGRVDHLLKKETNKKEWDYDFMKPNEERVFEFYRMPTSTQQEYLFVRLPEGFQPIEIQALEYAR